VGQDFNPKDGSLWWTDNQVDGMGDDIPPGELNRSTTRGQHFGFPWTNGGVTIAGSSAAPDLKDLPAPAGMVPPQVNFPAHQAQLGMSFYTLFQVMTLEGWSEEIARPIMAIYPSAWIFFLIFIFISTFIVVNLFVAVIVDSINSIKHHEQNKDKEDDVAAKIQALHTEIAELKTLIKTSIKDSR
jgi:hypothetical protein